MLTSKDFLIQGRAGNMLFRLASLIGLSKKHNVGLVLPKWPYLKYFEQPFPYGEVIGKKVTEPSFSWCDFSKLNWDEDVDLSGYLQSEKYWIDYKYDVRKALAFKPEFAAKVRAKANERGIFNKSVVALHIRRGDYVGNPNYEQLPITYYILALKENFPNLGEHNLLIFSDDIPYCKRHFECGDNIFFSEGNSDIEDLFLMSQCDHFVLSNSTFAWWGAYLGEKFHSKIIRPNYYFSGRLLMENDDKDFWPSRWTVFDYKNSNGSHKKINLEDVTFTIPVSYDHQDRKENIDLCIEMLKKHFDTNIFVFEQGTKPHFQYLEVDGYYFDRYGEKFHRTKMLNDMAKVCSTSFIFNWDADVIVPPLQILNAVNYLRKGTDMIFPYSDYVLVSRNEILPVLKGNVDIGVFKSAKDIFPHAVGGAVGFNRASFFAGGMENEKFISYGPEDVERILRFEKLGFKVECVNGKLYHINHFRGTNSGVNHPDYEANEKELSVIKNSTRAQLQVYIKNWPWIPKTPN